MTNLETLADERQRIKTDERNLLGALAEVRSKLDNTRTELQQSRKARDELNETVRALKKTRDNLRDKAKQNITKLKTLQKTAPKLLQSVTAEHELQQLEWQGQIPPLSQKKKKRVKIKKRAPENQGNAAQKNLSLRDEGAQDQQETEE